MSIRVHSWLKPALYALPLAWLWWGLINQLRISWSNNPQYAYGWAVPFLCAYLIWQRFRTLNIGHRTSNIKHRAAHSHLPSSIFHLPSSLQALPALLFALCALLYAPTRLIQEANPGWSPVNWALALIVIGLTLLSLERGTRNAERGRENKHFGMRSPERGNWESESRKRKAESGNVLRFPARSDDSTIPAQQFSDSKHRPSDFGFRTSDFGFPLGFFLVAVPWPSLIEQPVVQGLTRLNTALTIEILGWLGLPALQHGNVIELAAATVGIDEACSGIRSLQATLMLSLFFGELYRLSILRRALCVLAGFAVAMVCNLGRMLLLTWVASQKGQEAIAGWHDPAGISILVACFIGVWLFATRLGSCSRQRKMVNAECNDLPASTVQRCNVSTFNFQLSTALPLTLLTWLVLVEVGVAAWYHHVESGSPDSPAWTLAWPTNALQFRDVPIANKAAELLRYDAGRQAQWLDPDGARWQLSWFYWKPGQAAGYLAKGHTPQICMPSAGYAVSAISDPQFAGLGGLRFPFRIYSFEQAGNTVHVLYSRWEDHAREQSFATEGLSPRVNLLRSLWTGRGGRGQRVLSLAVWGARDGAEAGDLLLRQLEKVVVVEPLAGAAR